MEWKAILRQARVRSRISLVGRPAFLRRRNPVRANPAARGDPYIPRRELA
jgi:hypothetical protein